MNTNRKSGYIFIAGIEPNTFLAFDCIACCKQVVVTKVEAETREANENFTCNECK